MSRNSPAATKIQRWLDNFTFWPGFEFEYHANAPIEGVSMTMSVIIGRTPVWDDNRNPGRTSRGRFTFPFNEDMYNHPNGEEMFKRFMRQNMHHMVCHEADEWLMYNGVREWDPHAHK